MLNVFKKRNDPIKDFKEEAFGEDLLSLGPVHVTDNEEKKFTLSLTLDSKHILHLQITDLQSGRVLISSVGTKWLLTHNYKCAPTLSAILADQIAVLPETKLLENGVEDVNISINDLRIYAFNSALSEAGKLVDVYLNEEKNIMYGDS